MAFNPEAKACLTKTVAELRPWEGANLKVSRVEILQKMLKATAWIPGELGCRPAASGGVQPLAKNSILAYFQARETSGG